MQFVAEFNFSAGKLYKVKSTSLVIKLLPSGSFWTSNVAAREAVRACAISALPAGAVCADVYHV